MLHNWEGAYWIEHLKRGYYEEQIENEGFQKKGWFRWFEKAFFCDVTNKGVHMTRR